MTHSIACTLLLTASLGALADERDPREILKDAAEAAREVRTAIYQASLEDRAGFMGPFPQIAAAVKIESPPGDSATTLGGRVAMRGQVLRRMFKYDPDNPDSTMWLVHDGVKLQVRYEAKPWLITVDHEKHPATALGRPEMALFMADLVAARPYDTLARAASVTWGGRHEIEGVACERVDVRLRPDDTRQPEAPIRPLLSRCPMQRWYFGAEDHLPRRIEYFPSERAVGPVTVTFENVKTNGEFAEGIFVMPRARIWAPSFAEPIPPPPTPPPPPDQPSTAVTQKTEKDGDDRRKQTDEEKKAERAAVRNSPKPEVSDQAPDFELKDTADKKHRLSEYRGKVVVIDFWATWCGNCRKTRPVLNRLQEKYNDKPVAFLSINCLEAGGDPEAFIKKNRYPGTQLLKGNKTSRVYGVKSIPYIVVIDKGGKILRAESGYADDLDEQLSRLIDGALAR